MDTIPKSLNIINSTNILYSIAFYAPLIISISILLFSVFTGTIEKAAWIFLWIFVITFLRIIMFKGMNYGTILKEPKLPSICLTGLSEMFIPEDVTYSIYFLSFILMYFLMPMILISKQNNINVINYGVLGFFITYICLDIFIKSSLKCIPSFFSKLVLGDITFGLFLGGVISGLIMYGTNLKSYLYINELNKNQEVCSMPSKQQFKCSVYKNGELVGSSIK
jgi:hypothetical protein